MAAELHRGARPVLRFGLAATLICGAMSFAVAADVEGPLPTNRAARDFSDGMPLPGGWIFHPSFILGGVYDDNVYRSQINRIKQWGVRAIPSFTAELNNGIHRTSIYGTVDGRFYNGATQADAVDARAGVLHIYEAQRDLVFRFGGIYDRQADVFTNGIVNAAGNPIISNNQVNVLTGNASVQKDFSRQFFVVLGGTATGIKYDNALQSARDGTISTATSRAGFWISPHFNAFVEGSYDWRSYTASVFESNGYRVVGGFGSGQIGLLKGEVFGGYQAESFNAAAIGNVSSAVYGAKLSYFPTRYWTIKATVDKTIGVSAVATIGSPVGTAMRVTHAVLESDYGFWRQWSLSGRFGYDHADYVNSLRRDDAWFAGGRINFAVWSNLGVTFDYQYTKLQSNAVLASYDRNVFTVGANYRY